jgi:alcohol dehydrogenase YqhD (iron-dependent ADH family)
MQNFIFHIPTKIIFGKDQIGKIGKEVGRYGKKALLVYGMSSIIKNGIYDKVTDSLRNAGISFVDFPGVKSNPILSHVRSGIELARREQVDVVLAVGGGSVIDSAKAIAAGFMADHDVWDFFTFSKPVKAALPILTVVTVSASASEMNNGAVLTREDSGQKYSTFSPLFLPKVSILDPTALFSLDARYSAYSSVDIITHMLEGYFNNAEPSCILQDRLVEGLMKTVMESTEKILKEPDHYNARADIMWGAVLGFNGLTTAGLGLTAFPAHMIEHSLSALYDIPHGAGLAIILPAWMSHALEAKKERMARMAREIFQVQDEDPLQAARKGVSGLTSWFKTIGCPVSLSEANIPEADIEKIADNAVTLARLWMMKSYTKEMIIEILKNAR